MSWLEQVHDDASAQGPGLAAPAQPASAMSSWFLSGSAPNFVKAHSASATPVSSHTVRSQPSSAAAVLQRVQMEPEVREALQKQPSTPSQQRASTPTPNSATASNSDLLSQLLSGLKAEQAAVDEEQAQTIQAIRGQRPSPQEQGD